MPEEVLKRFIPTSQTLPGNPAVQEGHSFKIHPNALLAFLPPSLLSNPTLPQLLLIPLAAHQAHTPCTVPPFRPSGEQHAHNLLVLLFYETALATCIGTVSHYCGCRNMLGAQLSSTPAPHLDAQATIREVLSNIIFHLKVCRPRT